MTRRMKRVLVLGGGVAGMAAAVELARRGHKPLLLEEKHFLGGRAYSFRDSATGEEIDNGQHLLLTCYTHTRKFLRTIGALQGLYVPPGLEIAYREPGGRGTILKLGGLTPWTWGRPWFFLMRALFTATRGLDHTSVEDWLEEAQQPEPLRRLLYRPLAVAALNQDTQKASAQLWVNVLRRVFVSLRRPRLAIPAMGLSDLFAKPSSVYLRAHGAEIHCDHRVERLLEKDGGVCGVEVRGGKIFQADAVISALPPHVLTRLLTPDMLEREPSLAGAGQLTMSGIISIHLWLDAPLTQRVFAGLLDTGVQWLFNKQVLYARAGRQAHSIALVISAADAFMDMPKEALLQKTLEELRRLYPEFSRRNVLRSVVIKEKSATLSHELGQMALRPKPLTRIKNLYLAGDWVNTGLPATIESAIQSAHTCIKEIEGHTP